jgi:hypothetical protein
VATSGDIRELLGGSTREAKERDEDEPRREPAIAAGKLTRAEQTPQPTSPGKRTRLEDDPHAMSPAASLHYARWTIDRKAHTPGVDGGALASAFAFLDEVRGGEPLPARLQHRLARQLGVDLAAARVHVGGAAARAADLLGARALTIGTNIYFADGAYDPTTPAGIELIAHEAAHVAHNQRAGASGRGLSMPHDSHEREADAFAHDFAADAPGTLPTAIQDDLAGALDADVGDVRVHTDASAAAQAQQIGARAFTAGKDIYFAAGEYQPDTAAGRRLIAHEVAHTVQSSDAPADHTRTSTAADPHERKADAFAEAFASGGRAAHVGTAPAGMVHRDQTHEEQLAAIQGHEMSALLGKIPGLPQDVKTDYEAAGKVGGPRLQAAMRAVNEPSDWKTYITKYQGVAGHLPKDQLDILMKHLGGPAADFRYYKDIGNYDGSADGSTHEITIYWRVKFVSGKKFNDDQFDELSKEEVKKVAEDSKRKIETIWSGKGTLKCEADSVPAFTTKVVVEIVDTGQHSTITLQSGAQTGQNPKTGDRDGTWDPGVVRDQNNACVVFKDGKQQMCGPIAQSGAAHEFGHVLGLKHVDDVRALEDQLRNDGKPGHKKLSAQERKQIEKIIADHRQMQDNLYKSSKEKTGSGSYHGAGADAEYGSTEEEQRNIMGKGNDVKKIGGPDAFDPFVPFQKIAEKWGEEFLKVKTLNKWTSSNA